MAYPSIEAPGTTIVEEREDSVLKSEFEGGYQLTRQKYTRVRKKWRIQHPRLTPTNKAALATFIDTTTHGGADAFDWTNPADSTTYSVRFDKPPSFAAIQSGSGVLWSTDEFTLVQV